MNKAILRISQEDIDLGECRSPTACAVANAGKRLFHRPCSVGNTCLAVAGYEEYIDLPLMLASWVDEFDKTGRMEPANWEIEVPESIKIPKEE